MFSVLEQARDDLMNMIEDYTVTQVTLDDVFVNFARIQQENQSTEQISQEKWWKRNFIYKLFNRKKQNLIGKWTSLFQQSHITFPRSLRTN